MRNKKPRRWAVGQHLAFIQRMLNAGLIEQQADGETYRITTKGRDIAAKFQEAV